MRDVKVVSADRMFIAYIFALPFGSSISLRGPWPGLIDDFGSLLGALSIAALLGLWVIDPDRRRVEQSPAVPMWLLFFGWASLSGLWSVNRSATQDDVVVLGSLVLLSVMAASVRFGPRHRRLIRLSLAASGLFTGLIALVQWGTGSLASSGTDVPRFALAGDDPNITAATLLLPLAFCLIGLFEPTHRRPGRLPIWFYGTAAGTVVAAIVLTASRAGLAAAALVIAVVLFRHGSALQRAAFAAMGLLMVAVVDLPFESRASGLTGRSSIWNIGLLSCRESCWAGSGLGTFPDRHEMIVFARPELSANQFRFEAHNIWIGSIVELGIGATLLLFVLAAYALVTTYSNREPFSAAAFAGLAGVLTANMFVSNVEFKYFWLALVISTIACERDDIPLVLSRRRKTESMVGV